MASAQGAAKTSAKYTGAKTLLSSIKAVHSVLTQDPDVLFLFMEERGYQWAFVAKAWVKRGSK